MKNFRKVLALVLVVATLFSFASMASAKKLADYTDVASINYDEAVAVLSGIEILQGDPDGSFRPADPIKRSEMAKMIAIMANAGYEIDKLYADACKFADCTNSWAKSYIAYCASTGIVAGYSSTVFNPDGKVTALETAKMLLVLIGFDAEAQGYVNNANWKVNVLRDAKVMGLTNGLPADYNMEKNITREEAAQMMLNALEAPAVVGYLSGKIINVTNALVYDQTTFTANGNYAAVVNYATLKDALKLGNWALYGNVVISDDVLGWTLFGLLKNETTSKDCYGRPGTSWSWQTAKHGTITVGSFDNTLVKSFTTAADLKTLLATEAASNAYSLEFYVDGAKAADLETTIGAVYNKGADETALATKAAAVTGNGVLTEVYVNDVQKKITIVVINTYFGQVSMVTKASNTFTVKTLDAEAKSVELCFSNKGYDFAKGNYILFWLCGGNNTLHSAQKVTPAVTGAVTRTETTPIAVVGGNTYSYAKHELNYMDKDEVNQSENFGRVYAVYTDTYGYVKFWKDATPSAATYYAYAVENTGIYHDNGKAETDKYFTYTASYDIVDFEANYKEDQPIVRDYFNVLEANDVAEVGTRGKLMSYKLDAAGRISSVQWGEPKSGLTLAKNGNLVNATSGAIVAYGTEASKYLVRTWDYAEKKFVYNAYTENNLPEAFAGNKLIDRNGDGILDDVQNTIQVFLDKVTTIDGKETPIVKYLFIDAVYAASDVDVFVGKYVKSVSDAYFFNQIMAYDMYSAWIGGESSYLLVTKDQQTINNYSLYKAQLVVIGLYDDNKPIYAAVKAMDKYERLSWEYKSAHNEVFFNGAAYDVADGFYAVVYDSLTGKVTVVKSVAEINNWVEAAADVCTHGAACTTCKAWVTGASWATGTTSALKVLYLTFGTTA